MKRITNLTNSPYDVNSKQGTVRLPAFGVVEGDFDNDYINLLQLCSVVTVEDVGENGVEPEKQETKPKGKRNEKRTAKESSSDSDRGVDD